MKVFLFASLTLSAHEGTFICKLDAQCTWRCTLFASSMPNAHPWWWPFICKLDAQCTSMSVACHLQAQCSMCIHEGNLSFVSSKHNVHVSTRGFLAADEMRKRFSWMCYCCSCCFNVGCSNMLPKMDWLNRRFAAMKGSQISLCLISSCCDNNAINSWLPKEKSVSLLIKNSRQLELLYTLLKAIFRSFVSPFANKSPMPRRGVIHHLLLSLLRPSKKKRKTRRTTREKKKDLHALALGGKKLTKSFSKRRRSGVYLHRRRRRRRLPLCEVRTLSLSRKPAQPEEPSSTWAVIVALLPRNLLYFVASQLL